MLGNNANLLCWRAKREQLWTGQAVWSWKAAELLLYMDWPLTAACRKQLREQWAGLGLCYPFYKTCRHLLSCKPRTLPDSAGNVVETTMTSLKHQHLLNPSSALSENKSVPPPRANASWEQRLTLGRGLTSPVSRSEQAAKQVRKLAFRKNNHMQWNSLREKHTITK